MHSVDHPTPPSSLRCRAPNLGVWLPCGGMWLSSKDRVIPKVNSVCSSAVLPPAELGRETMAWVDFPWKPSGPREITEDFSARKLSPPRLDYGAADGIQVWAHVLRSKPGLQECPHQPDVNIPGSKVLTLALLGTGFPKACAYRLSFPHWPLSTWALCKLGCQAPGESPFHHLGLKDYNHTQARVRTT